MTRSTKDCTSGKRCEPVTPREAWYCQVHHTAGVRLDDIAATLEMRADTLAAMVNPHGNGSILPARYHEQVLALTSANLAVLTFYARVQGAVVYRPSMDTPLAQVAAAVREFGDLLSTTASAHSDGAMTPHEAVAIARDGEEAVHAILAIVDDARKRAGWLEGAARQLARRDGGLL